MKGSKVKLPPQSIEAEQSILGAILLDDTASLRAAKAGLDYRFFYREDNGLIYQAMKEVFADLGTVDIITLAEMLDSKGRLEKVGGSHYLSELVDATGTAANIENYVHVVKQKAALREEILISQRATEMAYSQGADPVEIAAGVADKMLAIKKGASGGEEIKKSISAKEIEDWINQQERDFTRRDIIENFSMGQKEKKNLHTQMARFKEAGLIEGVGSASGKWRKIEEAEGALDWQNAKNEKLDLLFPFGLEKLITMAPGNILLIEGEKGAGKTAFCFDFIRMNMGRGDWPKIKYFTVESGASEVRTRILLFNKDDDPSREDWGKGFDPFTLNRTGLPNDIDPDGISLIDYFDADDDFWTIGQEISRVYKKIKDRKGVVIACVQKKPSEALGVGGYQNRKRPSHVIQLCVSRLDQKEKLVKIINARGRTRPTVDPAGMVRWYKFPFGAHACGIGSRMDWMEEDPEPPGFAPGKKKKNGNGGSSGGYDQHNY